MLVLRAGRIREQRSLGDRRPARPASSHRARHNPAGPRLRARGLRGVSAVAAEPLGALPLHGRRGRAAAASGRSSSRACPWSLFAADREASRTRTSTGSSGAAFGGEEPCGRT
jgi:hypothetical protein